MQTVGGDFEMRTVGTIIYLLCFLNLCGQSRQLFLQIDTIQAIEEFNANQWGVYITNQGFTNLGDSAWLSSISFSQFPNFTALISIETDSSNLRLPIDDGQGYLEICGLNLLRGDTLKISRLIVYNNCYPDTSLIVIRHLRKSSKSEEFKLKRLIKKLKVNKPKCQKPPPDVLHIIINEKEYKAEIMMAKDPMQTFISGNRIRPMKYYKMNDYTGPVRRMRIETELLKYFSVATITLDNK